MPFIRFITLSMLFMLLAALPSQPMGAKSSDIGDRPYEPNDTCGEAQNISTDGIFQEHAFQVSGDVDWVQFDAISGIEYRIEVTVPFGSSANVSPALYHSCDTSPAGESWGGTFSPGARLMFTTDQDGPIYLRFANYDDSAYGEDVNYRFSVQTMTNDPQYGALIVVAGRFERDDHLQKNIHNVTDQVYRTFQGYGYSDDDIYYLATDSGLTGYDAAANIEHLHFAITGWAMEQLSSDDTLTLYIMGHGNRDAIYIDKVNDEVLTPEDLDIWLTALEGVRPNLKINIILDTCHAGSFIEGDTTISKEGRVVITSSSNEGDTYASRAGSYFSDRFLTTLGQGRNLSDSFADARDSVKSVIPFQHPWLDADGNGVPNEINDFEIAAQRSFDYIDTESDNKWPPYITNVAGSMNIDAARSLIQAEIWDDGQIVDVWAVIYPPSYTPPESRRGELIDEGLPTLKLESVGENLFSAEYDAFDEVGIYRFVIHAEDDEGLIARPVTLTFLVDEDIVNSEPSTSADWGSPFIVNMDGTHIDENGDIFIQSTVYDDIAVKRVWALIYSPSFTMPYKSSSLIDSSVSGISTLDLEEQGNGKYQAEYGPVNEKGQYRVIIYAEDSDGHQASPVSMSLDFLPILNNGTIIPTIDYDCHNNLPTGPGEAADCVAGFIYVDGEPAEGITVQVQNQSGESETVQTKVYPGLENRPFYHFNLAKLNIHTHQTFTVTVQHDDQHKHIDFIAKPGFQMVDVVMPSSNQTRPIATINYPARPRIDPDSGLIIEGTGHPGTLGSKINSYKWENLATGTWLGGGSTLELPANYLSPGSHTLSLKVKDSNGNWSTPTTIEVQVAAAPEKPWTFLLYLSADFHDDGNLQSKFQNMLDDLDKALGSDNVQIAAQVDGPEDGDTERWLIRNGHSPVVDKAFCEQRSCEVKTDQPDALADFLRWGQTNLPAERYYLAIANHGQAIQGIAWDTTSDLADDGIQNDSAYLTIQELGEALHQPGVQPVDILHLDACSMNLLETAFELQNLTDVLISSQYLAWDYFAYDQYLDAFADLSLTSQEVSAEILTHYAELAEANEYPYTISALDIKNAPTVLAAFNQISNRLLELRDEGKLDEQNLNAVREQVQKFDSHGDQTNDPTDYYIDMLDWSTKLTSTVIDRELKLYAAELTPVLVKFIIANFSKSNDLPGRYDIGAFVNLEQANGLSVFYPMNYNSEAYEAYINHEIFSFTAVSSWTDFLSGLGGATASQSGDIEPYPGPLSHLETQSPKLYLPLIMR